MIAIDAAIRDTMRKTEWGTIGGSNWCAIKTYVDELIGIPNNGSKLPASEKSKQNCVNSTVSYSVTDTIRISVVSANREPMRNTKWGSIGGSKRCANRASVVEAIGRSNVGSKRRAVKQSK